MGYELAPFASDDIAHWDDCATSYPEFEVFHRQAWLDYLAESRGVDIRHWHVTQNGRRIGVLCGGIVTKGPFRIAGSPLKGWGTNAMGALLQPGYDPIALLRALEDWARADRVAMWEVEQRGLSEAALAASGFNAAEQQTYHVQISTDEDRMLRRLHKGRRSGVKRAIASGLVAELANDDSVADEFYDLFTAVMRNKGLAPGYPREYPRLLVRHLQRISRVLALRVRGPNGEVLAVGLFPYDNRTLYFWGGADSFAGRQFCPNDFLHWSAMCLGAERGCTLYDMSGYGRFKREFGGELITLRRWHKGFSMQAVLARRAFEAVHQYRTRLRSWTRVLRPQRLSVPGDVPGKG